MEPTNARTGAVTCRRGVPEGAEGEVAALYWNAFGRKLGPALDPRRPGGPSSPHT